MDKIGKGGLVVERLELDMDMFETCLGFERLSESKKLVSTMKMKSGTEIVLYDSRQVYKEGDKILKIIVDDQDVDKLKTFLESHNEKFYYKEKHEYGISRVLNWQMDNGSMIDFSSID